MMGFDNLENGRWTRKREEENCNDVKDDRGTKGDTLRGLLVQFVDDTSVHGVKNSFGHSRRSYCRVVWGLLGLLAIAVLVVMVYRMFLNYSSYPFNTVVQVKPTDQLPFPTVTICNINTMEASKLKMSSSTASGNSSTWTALSFLLANTTDIIHSLPVEILNSTYQELIRPAFASLNTTLLACFWDGDTQPCDRLFSPLDLDHRRCFQFNGPKEEHVGEDGGGGRRAYVSRAAGMTSGLQVVVNVRQEEYLFNQELSAGAQVILHEPDEMPDFDNKGFLAAPGFSTNARTTQTKYQFLPAPFKAFGNESCVEDLPMPADLLHTRNTTYTSALCHTVALVTRTQDQCGCRMSDLSVTYHPALPLCSVRDVFACYYPTYAVLTKRLKRADVRCPRRCRRTEYQTTVSSAYFPSQVAVTHLSRLPNLDLPASAWRKNLVSLKVFYDDLVTSEATHVPEYTIGSILGTLGGHMGLFIGASLLSVVEVVELVMKVMARAVLR